MFVTLKMYLLKSSLILASCLISIAVISFSCDELKGEEIAKKDKTQQLKTEIKNLSDKNPLKVSKAVKSILVEGYDAIPFLIKFARENYLNDFNQVARVYIPVYTPKFMSIVDNGTYLTPSALSIYLIESIRRNKEIHSLFLLDYKIEFKYTEYSDYDEIKQEKFIYECIILNAIERYERWWKLRRNKQIISFRDNIIWPWPSKIPWPDTPENKNLTFMPLDFEKLRAKLPHQKVKDKKWNNSSDKEKCGVLSIAPIWLQLR